MPTLLIYLFKVNVALVLFCAGYYFIFRRLTFYTLNRVYLIVALLFSSTYPLVDFGAILLQHDVVKPLQITDAQLIYSISTYGKTEASASLETYWQYLLIIFWMGATFMGIRLVLQFTSLFNVHRRSVSQTICNRQVRIIEDEASAFSFWQSIYINPTKYSENEIESVVAHEDVHVKQWHTLDILLAEVSLVFYWFNPGIWLIKKAISENLEFITDREILKQGINAKNYQYILLYASFNTSPNAVVNHFNISTIKKRIMMMNAKKSSAFSLGRYGLIIPVVAALLFIFGTSKAELIKKSVDRVNEITDRALSVAKDEAVNKAVEANLTTTTTQEEKRHTKQKLAAFSRAMPTIQTANVIADTPKVKFIPKKAIMFPPGSESTYCVLNGKQITTEQANNIETDKIESITVLKGSSAVNLFGEAASQGAVIIVTKGEENSAAVQSIMQKIAAARVTEIQGATNAGTSTFSTVMPTPKSNANTFSTASAKADSSIKSNNNPRPVVAIGSKPQNRTITVRGFASPQKKTTVGPNGSLRQVITEGYPTHITPEKKSDLASPLFIINGKPATKEDFDKLDQDKIESINVLKDASAKALWGENAKDGVILITTKEGSKGKTQN